MITSTRRCRPLSPWNQPVELPPLVQTPDGMRRVWQRADPEYREEQPFELTRPTEARRWEGYFRLFILVAVAVFGAAVAVIITAG
jgi:hypothetical protein